MVVSGINDCECFKKEGCFIAGHDPETGFERVLVDVDGGRLLWEVRLGAPPHGYPITYAVKRRQYIAVPTIMGVFKLMTAQQMPDIYQPSGGNALYVFELTD